MTKKATDVEAQQYGEEGLKGGPPPGPSGGNPFASAGAGGFPGGFSSSSFTSGGPGGASFGFSPSDPNDLFSRIFGAAGGGGGGNPFAGAGGFGGGRGGFGDDDFMSAMGGMPSGAGGKRRQTAPPAEADEPPKEIQKPLAVSLEDLYAGTSKKLKLTCVCLLSSCRRSIF